MADDLSKKILIDIEVGTDGQEQISQYKAAFDSLRNTISGLTDPLGNMSNNISSLQKDIAKLSGSIGGLNNQNKALAATSDNAKNKVSDASLSFSSWGSLVRALTEGLSGFQKTLTSGLAVIAAFGPEVRKWVISLAKGKDTVDQTKVSVDGMNRSLQSSDYTNAIRQMNQVNTNVLQAQKGFLDKKQILRQYNETLGKTIGEASDLNEAEAKITKGGEAYVKMTLLKASAQLALQDAVTKAHETEQEQATPLNNDTKASNPENQSAIVQAQSNAEQLKKIEETKDMQINELADKFNKEKNNKAKKAAEELTNFQVQQEKKLANEAFSIVSQSIKQEADAKIAGLERDKEAELNNSSLTSAQKLAIEQKFKQQEAQVKIKAFKQEQEASIAQAVINGALAITKDTAQTGVLSALYIPAIIAETAVEVAKIAAQKPPAYASGGLHYNSDGMGGVLPGYSRTDNTNAWLRSGEGVVVSEAMRVPWARNLVSAINVGFGGRDFSITNPGRGYAVGGIFTDGGDANRYYNQPVHDQKNLANSIAYQMINNFPPVYVDVKDINNQQNILAQTINRVNL